MLEPVRAEGSAAIWWERETFLSSESDDNRCPAVIDVTGQARYLTYGPFIELRPGFWRARVLLEVCIDAARRRLAVQFGVEPAYTTVELPYGVPGRHEIVVEHRLAEAGPVQIRLYLQRAAFHGEVRFLGAYLERLGDPAE